MEDYGKRIRQYRVDLGLTQNQVAMEMGVTPGYISNVEKGRTAMSLRMLVYYAKIMGVTLDSLVGELEPKYSKTSIDNELLKEISKLSDGEKEKLLATIKIWTKY